MIIIRMIDMLCIMHVITKIFGIIKSFSFLYINFFFFLKKYLIKLFLY